MLFTQEPEEALPEAAAPTAAAAPPPTRGPAPFERAVIDEAKVITGYEPEVPDREWLEVS